jgi:hypothetical protein
MDTARNKLVTFHEGDYTVHNFVDFCHLHHPAFSPMYDIQEKYQRFLLGLGFWLAKGKWREENRKFKSVEALVNEFDKFGVVKPPEAAQNTNPALPVLGDSKPKLTLKAAHAQIHPTEHPRRGSKENNDVHDSNHNGRRGSKESNDLNQGGRRGSKDSNEAKETETKADAAPRAHSHDGYSGFDASMIPTKREVNHLHVESNFKSVATVELRRSKSFVELSSLC